MFVFAVFLLILASITFFMGSNMLKICYTIAEDAPNDDIPSYEVFSRVNLLSVVCIGSMYVVSQAR